MRCDEEFTQWTSLGGHVLTSAHLIPALVYLGCMYLIVTSLGLQTCDIHVACLEVLNL